MSAILVCLIQGLYPLGTEISQALELILTDVHTSLSWYQTLQWTHETHLWLVN